MGQLPEYLCPIRKLQLSVKHSVGERCYLGSTGNICNTTGKLCEIIEAHELSQSQPKCTGEVSDGHSSEIPGNWISRDGGGEAFVRDLPQDHGPLGKPSYEKRDDPSLRSKVIKRY